MEYEKIEIGKKSIGRQASCICVNYNQFTLDCDTLTDCRYDGFSINPKERFHDRVKQVLYEFVNDERTLPCRFTMRLEGKHSICNCRIDYVFEVMEKTFLKENIRAKELPEAILNECMNSEVDCIILYTGMNK